MADSEDRPPNEVMAAAHEAKAKRSAARKSRKQLPLGAIGVGVGVGSAALAAALLFANRGKKRDR